MGVFVKGIEGEYALKEEYRRQKDSPRVIKADSIPWREEGPNREKYLTSPQTCPGQSLHLHIEELPPGGAADRHGHMNEAIFYILEGKGYEIHDGKRYDWEEGDAVIVHDASVHQHFNPDPKRRGLAIVFKAKPMFIFLGLVQQGKC